MSSLQIKVCGVTRIEDALLAEELGAFAIGFIFAPSSRRISSRNASFITQALKKETSKIGVFVNSHLHEMVEAIDEASLSAVQLHGKESMQIVEQLRQVRPQLKILKAIEVESEFSLQQAAAYNVDFLLLDSPRRQAEREVLSVQMIQRNRPHKPFLIAGGLSTLNVRSFVAALEPNGVDVSSSIESSPGIKCPQKMKLFFQALQRRGLQNGS